MIFIVKKTIKPKEHFLSAQKAH